MTEEPNSPGPASNLPTKISGIVFWGTVLIGLLIAFIILKDKESELALQYRDNAKILQTVITKSLEYSGSPDFDETTRRDMEHNLQPFRNIIHYDAIEIRRGNRQFLFGRKSGNEDAIAAGLAIRPVYAHLAPYSVQTSIYFPSLQQLISTYRKWILLSIALLMMVFGLILQFILQRLLSQPFARMVHTAQQFADGDTAVRFDANRDDEFGFLSKFINRALDSRARQYAELMDALKRATQSEAALLAQKERMAVTLNSLSEAVISTDARGVVDYLNPVAEKMTGWPLEEARGHAVLEVVTLIDEISRLALPNPVTECLQQNTTVHLAENAALLLRDDHLVSVDAAAAPMRNADGEVVGTVMVCSDVSHTRRLAMQLSHQVSHDSLTNLVNRSAFEQRLDALLDEIRPPDTHALLYIDLDQFKVVNDTCGHTAGDELLRQLAQVLLECIRRSDVLARLGGDEFGILLINCDLAGAIETAEKIRQAVKDFRFAWIGSVFEIGASIGVVEINADNLNASTIMSSADLACYAAKDSGRNRVHVYEKTDDVLLQRHGEMHWIGLIAQALEEGRFVLYQQPICALSDAAGEAHHWEILLRMRDGHGGIILPNFFVSAAERYNKMQRIDRWVIYNVFSALSAGAFGVGADGRRLLAINLSGSTLSDESVLAFIQDTGKSFGIDFSQICFEITETVAISNLSKATTFIRELKKLGCKFSLDDFGSGLSSFGYLKNLPVDFIKIDGSFVKDMVTDPIDRAMVDAITEIGHVMKIKTIAEWVEDEATLALLTDMGVDFAQGYHLGRPAEVTGVHPVCVI
ncbi:MAG: EAL domain-containing protein [Betaproteobacteria bacterium]|nr:EAL domain-containing protein [Betaproteobacteria bacterium]